MADWSLRRRQAVSARSAALLAVVNDHRVVFGGPGIALVNHHVAFFGHVGRHHLLRIGVVSKAEGLQTAGGAAYKAIQADDDVNGADVANGGRASVGQGSAGEDAAVDGSAVDPLDARVLRGHRVVRAALHELVPLAGVGGGRAGGGDLGHIGAVLIGHDIHGLIGDGRAVFAANVHAYTAEVVGGICHWGFLLVIGWGVCCDAGKIRDLWKRSNEKGWHDDSRHPRRWTGFRMET